MPVALLGATLGGIAAFLVARRLGRGPAEALAGPRLTRLRERVERRPLLTIVLARARARLSRDDPQLRRRSDPHPAAPLRRREPARRRAPGARLHRARRRGGRGRAVAGRRGGGAARRCSASRARSSHAAGAPPPRCRRPPERPGWTTRSGCTASPASRTSTPPTRTAPRPSPSSSTRREVGADCVLLTDHDTLEARRRGEEGWRGGVLLLVGHEVSPKAGHLLVFGLDHEIPHAGRTEREICTAVLEAGGVAFAAHPFSEGSRMSKVIAPPHGWELLDDAVCGGIELWSLTSDSAEAWRTPWEAAAFLRDPMRALTGPPAAPPRDLGPALPAPPRAGDRRPRRPPAGHPDPRAGALADAQRAVLRAAPDPRAAALRADAASRPPTAPRSTTRSARAAATSPSRRSPPDAGSASGRSPTAPRRRWGPAWTRAAGPCGRWRRGARALRLLRDGAPVHEAEGDRLEHAVEEDGLLPGRGAAARRRARAPVAGEQPGLRAAGDRSRRGGLTSTDAGTRRVPHPARSQNTSSAAPAAEAAKAIAMCAISSSNVNGRASNRPFDAHAPIS